MVLTSFGKISKTKKPSQAFALRRVINTRGTTQIAVKTATFRV
jgi:hypothetical protein